MTSQAFATRSQRIRPQQPCSCSQDDKLVFELDNVCIGLSLLLPCLYLGLRDLITSFNRSKQDLPYSLERM